MTVLAIYQLLEDPPWESKSKEKLSIDWTGIGLIALGLGCLQVMLDRGKMRTGSTRTLFVPSPY